MKKIPITRALKRVQQKIRFISKSQKQLDLLTEMEVFCDMNLNGVTSQLFE
jgi:hypothetical protein